jgi:large subunit ribosomal protein L5
MSPKSFDGKGNYTIALKDQLVFPEINYNKVEKTKGMSITFVTSAGTNTEGLALLKTLGMPFK